MATYESVDEALRQPDDVTVLELYGDEFISEDLEVPPEIVALQQLEKLEISVWGDVKLPPELAELPKLHTLIIDECGFERLPQVIYRCKNLINLELCNDATREISDQIGHLRHLKSLTLSGLRYLPDTLALLHKLTYLDLSHCTFPTLPRSVGDLPALSFLDVSYTPLEELPRWLMQAPLEILRWERGYPHIFKGLSKIQQIRQAWGELTQLQELYLGHQHIIDVTSHVRNWEHLHLLDLSYNGMDFLPEEIGYIPNLKELYLQQNNLTDLPMTLGACRKLEVIDLFQNPISNLPEVVLEIPSLREVGLGQTNIPDEEVQRYQLQYPHITFHSKAS
ncbi:MAG TPA: hypothetical protein DCE41_16605 [Cytophagales bacterium]|nr:hypothetical protein [Cytophagales bacterium]HAA17634.1 hypothetical protein [Cytophagales bacterium]HAP63950.1 hypothetical protein [Cytophagales bacterium]